MKYPKYPAYKDSGVEWIGEIPEHWHTVRLKFLCQLCADYGANIKSEYYSESGVRFIRITDINEDGTIVPDGVFVPDYLVKEKMLKNGDLLFARSGSVGTSYIHDQNDSSLYSFAGYLVRFRVKDGNFAKFIYFFSKSQSYYDQIQALSIESTIQNFNGEKFSNMYLPIVDPAEQIIIAKFIDNKTSKIETIISNLQKMIELLKEKRQAIITHAVTKGLDPNVPTKDSGIEWIGEIPEHWKLIRLKSISRILFSNVDKHSSEDERPVHLANYTDVYKNHIITNNMEFMEATASVNEIRKFKLNVGDVLVTKDSETADDIAIPAIVRGTIPNLLCGYHLAMIRPDTRWLESDFLFYTYSNKRFRGKYESEANGITRFGLSQDSFNETYICLPNKEEQVIISSFLATQTSKIDLLASKQQKMIELLKEYRSSLINQAVTGKIDVQNIKINEISGSNKYHG